MVQKKGLVELLLSESEILIDKTQRGVSEVIIRINDANLEEKRDELYKKHSKYQQELEERRQRKWKKFKKIILHKTLKYLYQRPKYHL